MKIETCIDPGAEALWMFPENKEEQEMLERLEAQISDRLEAFFERNDKGEEWLFIPLQ